VRCSEMVSTQPRTWQSSDMKVSLTLLKHTTKIGPLPWRIGYRPVPLQNYTRGFPSFPSVATKTVCVQYG
jgi:hypothetical protein